MENSHVFLNLSTASQNKEEKFTFQPTRICKYEI